MSASPQERVTRRDVLRIVSVLALVLISLGVLSWWMLQPGLPTFRLIDLSAYYNARTTESTLNTYTKRDANNLGKFPLGTNQFTGVPFAVGGLIQLGNKDYQKWRVKFPSRLDGIAIGRRCARLHLLHGTGGNAGADVVIALLQLHYSDSSSASIPIIYNKHVEDWWFEHESARSCAEGSIIAWRGDNHAARVRHQRLRIYKSTFSNPNPNKTLVNIDYVSTLSACSPFLLGLTVE